MSELSFHELEIQQGELLPEREALGHFNFPVDINVTQVAVATVTNAKNVSNAAFNISAIWVR